MNIRRFYGSLEDLSQKFLSEGHWLNVYIIENFYYTCGGTLFRAILSAFPLVVDDDSEYKRIIKAGSKVYKVISETYFKPEERLKVYLRDNLKPLEQEYEMVFFEYPNENDDLEKKPKRPGLLWRVHFCKIEKGLIAFNEDINLGKLYFKWEDNRNRQVLLEFDLETSGDMFFTDYDMQTSILDLCKKFN